MEGADGNPPEPEVVREQGATEIIEEAERGISRGDRASGKVWPVRIRRRARLRLRCIHGARLTRADQEEQADAAGSALGEQPSSQSDPASYFHFLDHDNEYDYDDDFEKYMTRGKDVFWTRFDRPSDEIVMSCSISELCDRLPYDEIVATLAGRSFHDYWKYVAQVAQFRNEKTSEEYEAAQNQKAAYLGDFAGSPVQPLLDSKESCPSEDGSTALVQMPRKLDIGEQISDQELLGFMAQLPPTHCIDPTLQQNLHKKTELYERHALYRIRACKLLQGKYISQLSFDYLKKRYKPEYLVEKGYFRRYEKDGTFCWFFHPDHCERACLDDYQRLVLVNDHGWEYDDWDTYCFSYNTHEIDREYVKFYETFSNQVKWLEEYVHLYSTCRQEWWKIRGRAFNQAMKAATSFTKISVHLVRLAFREYSSSITYDYCFLKDLDGVYFEIWKRVTKQQKSFLAALGEVCQLNKFPLRQARLEHSLQVDGSYCEREFNCCTADIYRNVADDKAFELIAKNIKKMFKKPKGYEQYARKKLKIAELLRLISKA